MNIIRKYKNSHLGHVHHTYPEIFFPQIFVCGFENFRVHTQRIRIVLSRPHVSMYPEIFDLLFAGENPEMSMRIIPI